MGRRTGKDGMNDNLTPPVITVDIRECRSKVCAYLEKSQRIVIEYEDLASGDYVCDFGVAVERKESADFVNSILDNRLFNQVYRLKCEYERPVFIIEGNIFETRSQIPPAALIGAVSYLSVIEKLKTYP